MLNGSIGHKARNLYSDKNRNRLEVTMLTSDKLDSGQSFLVKPIASSPPTHDRKVY